jgi:hypothetical protein
MKRRAIIGQIGKSLFTGSEKSQDAAGQTVAQKVPAVPRPTT